MTENDRDEALTKRFIDVIMVTVQEMIPVQEILKTYISQDGAPEEVDVESIRGDEYDNEDPEVEESNENTNTENEGAEENNNIDTEPMGETPPEPEPEETKQIPLDNKPEVPTVGDDEDDDV